RQPLAYGAREILAAGVALFEVGEPGEEGLGQRLDRIAVATGLGEREGARPPIVVDVAHRRLAPRALAVAAIVEIGHQDVVAVLEDVGRDLEDRAHLALDGIASAVHGGLDALDDDGAAGRVDRPDHSAHGARLKPSVVASGRRSPRASGRSLQTWKNRFWVAQ